jgi:hypothetical protein
LPPRGLPPRGLAWADSPLSPVRRETLLRTTSPRRSEKGEDIKGENILKFGLTKEDMSTEIHS